MKRFTRIIFALLVCLMATACKGIFGDYEGTEEFRNDIAVFADYAVRKQLIVLKYLEYTSDGFTRDILQGTVSADEYDDFFKSVADMVPYIEDYEKAFKTLEKSGILTSISTKGLISSGKAFFSWMTGSGKRSRERVLTVASNLSPADRSELYNKLRSEWKGKTSSESDFWKKMENGDFDTQAPQMFNDFQQDNEEFALTSVDKGLTLQRIVVLEGAEGVKAGAELMTDVISTATPLGDGIAAAQVGQLTLDLYNANSNADRAKIAAAIASNLAGMKWKDPILGIIGGDAGVDLVVETLKETVDVAKTDAQNTAETKKSFVVVEDTDSQDQADIVIAQNQASSAPSKASISVAIGNIIDEGVKFAYTILNKGKWLLTAIDKNGNKETQAVEVPAGEVIYVTLSTTPPVSDEKETEQPADYTDWNKITEQYVFLKSYPPFSGTCTFVGYSDNMFYMAVTIRAKTSDAEKYRAKIGNYGFEDHSSSGNIIYWGPKYGNYYAHISFAASSTTGYTDIMFKNLL